MDKNETREIRFQIDNDESYRGNPPMGKRGMMQQISIPINRKNQWIELEFEADAIRFKAISSEGLYTCPLDSLDFERMAEALSRLGFVVHTRDTDVEQLSPTPAEMNKKSNPSVLGIQPSLAELQLIERLVKDCCPHGWEFTGQSWICQTPAERFRLAVIDLEAPLEYLVISVHMGDGQFLALLCKRPRRG